MINDIAFPILKFVLQLCVIFGTWLLVRPAFNGFTKQIGASRLRRQELKDKLLRGREQTARLISPIQRHFEDMMILTNKDYETNISYHRFLINTLLLGGSVFMASLLSIANLPSQISNNPFNISLDGYSHQQYNWRVALIFGLVSLIIPYLRLRYRYIRAYTKSSYDLMEPTKLITKFAYLSVDKALAETAKIMADTNVLKRPLRQLSQVFVSYRNEEELLREAKRFTNLIGTAFAAQFTNNLLYAEREGGGNMKNDFLFLHEAMEHQRSMIMDVRANSSDAIQIGVWVNLFTFLALISSLIYFMRPAVYLRLQLETTMGLSMLTAIVVSFVLSFVFSVVLSRPKLDY